MSGLVLVYGAGGHGKVVAEILLASGRAVGGFLDDEPAFNSSRVLNRPVFAASEWLKQNTDALVALGIGDNSQRERVARRVASFGRTLVTAIHPSASVSRSAEIGEGAIIMSAAVLNADCEIGEGVIVNTGAIVEHDVRVGRYVHLAPGCITGGGVEIGDFVQIGIAAVILPGKRIGRHAVIGAGAVVIEDIPENVTAFGVPARIHSRAKTGSI